MRLGWIKWKPWSSRRCRGARRRCWRWRLSLTTPPAPSGRSYSLGKIPPRQLSIYNGAKCSRWSETYISFTLFFWKSCSHVHDWRKRTRVKVVLAKLYIDSSLLEMKLHVLETNEPMLNRKYEWKNTHLWDYNYDWYWKLRAEERNQWECETKIS